MSLSFRRLSSYDSGFETELAQLLNWEERESPELTKQTSSIVEDVRQNGDAAVLKYTQKFDSRDVEVADELVVSTESMKTAWTNVPEQTKELIQKATERIRQYHEQQSTEVCDLQDSLGNHMHTQVTPLERVGIYVPGGQASYPSTVLMTVIPAQTAGVKQLIVTLPMPHGKVSEVLLGVLHYLGISIAFSIGGAQAIAALAYGTENVPKVDKIVGPGGSWVAAAKKQVFGPVGIESIAGPSEILIVADGSVNPRWVAWDLMSQAEHDAHAQSILISPNSDYLTQVERCTVENLAASSRSDIITQSLENRGALITCKSIEEGIDIANQIAPEHLQLAVEDARHYLPRVVNAGAVFLGAFSAEAFGDYVAGPSHVLPTFGTARYASVLGVQDFQKRTSVIEISNQGAQELGKLAGDFADLEGLDAHATAARIRVDGYDHNL